MYPQVQHFLDAVWTAADRGRSLPVATPATGDTIGTVALAEPADLDHALDTANRGFGSWPQVSASARSKVTLSAADLLRERSDNMAPLLTMQQGKPLPAATGEILAAADVIDRFADEACRTYRRVIPARVEGVDQLVVNEPVGPVAAFTPRNIPINQVVRNLSRALAAGCLIIVSFDELATEANRLPCGLASGAHSRPARTANARVAAVERRMISINHHGFALPEVHCGDVRQSEYGSEGDAAAIENNLDTTFVTQAGR